MNRLTSTAIAALLATPFAFAQPVLAQSSDTAEDGASGDSMESAQSDSGGMSSEGSQSGGMATDADPLIVTVGDTEITASDVSGAIASLPPQMQQTPPEQLIPFAVEQLILRELILQDAEAQGISGNSGSDSASSMDDSSSDDSDEMTSSESDTDMSGSEESETADAGSSGGAQSEMAQQNATIEAYMQQQMEGVVTDETVQELYDDFSSNATGEVPPLEDVRPQIEQQLRQQKLEELRSELTDGVEIVYYGPDGEPRETTAATDESSSDTDTASGGGMDGSTDSGDGSSTETDGADSDSDTSSGMSGSDSGDTEEDSGN